KERKKLLLVWMEMSIRIGAHDIVGFTSVTHWSKGGQDQRHARKTLAPRITLPYLYHILCLGASPKRRMLGCCQSSLHFLLHHSRLHQHQHNSSDFVLVLLQWANP